MKILIEGKNLFDSCNTTGYFTMGYFTKRNHEEVMLFELQRLSFRNDLYDLNNLILHPACKEFDYILADVEIPYIELYWGDILMRRIQLKVASKVECFFDDIPFLFIDQKWADLLKYAIHHFTTSSSTGIPVTIL